MKSILFKNINKVSSQGIELCDVFIENDKIKKIGQGLDMKASRVIEGEGRYLFPGIIDTQVHFRDPGLTHKEDLRTGSQAAALGGVTTFLEMPNTNPSTTTVEAIEDKVALGLEKSVVNFGFFMGATGHNLDELKKVDNLKGCPGVKIFLGSSTGDLLLYEADRLKEVFRETSCMIACHSENEEMLRDRKSIQEQGKTAHTHPEWRNAETAYSSTKRLLELARECGRKVHVLHITTKEEMELLSQSKDVCTVEVTPQHLSLSAPSCYDELGSYAQMNPPIRTLDHQEGLWKGIEDGTVDVIGSDHAPHTKEEKDLGYPRSPSGMPGVQTTFPLMLTHVHEGKLTLARLVELLCERPAELYGLESKGYIKEGMDADLVLVNYEENWIIENKDQASKVGWTPFHGRAVKGRPLMTIVSGEIVVEEGKLTGLQSGRPV